MANYAPIVIKNGRMQQLQAADTLVVPQLNVKGVGAGSISNANVDTDPTGIARFSVSESGTVKGVLQYIGSSFATPSIQNMMTMGSIGTTPIGFVYNSVERMRLQTGLNVGGTVDPGVSAIAAQTQAATATGYVHVLANDYGPPTNSLMRVSLALADNAVAGNVISGVPWASTGLVQFQNCLAALFMANNAIPMIFATTGAERMRLGAGLNLGNSRLDPGFGNIAVGAAQIPITPAAVFRFVLFGTSNIMSQPGSANTNSFQIHNNAIYNGTNFVHALDSAVPSGFYMLRGDFVWRVAPTGVAGSAGTPIGAGGSGVWTEPMKLYASGGLAVGAGGADPGSNGQLILNQSNSAAVGSALKFYTSHGASSAARNWAIIANGSAWGDLSIVQSSSASSDPLTSLALPVLYFSAAGGLTLMQALDCGQGNLMLKGNAAQGGSLFFGNAGGAASRYLRYNTTTNAYEFIAAPLYANGVLLSSSATLKRKIRDWKPTGSRRLRVRTFERKTNPGVREIGFVAEEITFKEVVGRGPSIDMGAVLAKHELDIQELQDTLERWTQKPTLKPKNR